MALHNKPKGMLPGAKKAVQLNDELVAPHPEFRTVEEELEYLRAENAYLKKLRALIQANQQKKHE